MNTDTVIKPSFKLHLYRINPSLLLFIATILAIMVANSLLKDYYQHILSYPIQFNVLGLDLFAHHGEPMSFSLFVNDVLMVLFFFIVGLDIKQQFLIGELSSARRAILPVVGAIGGMIVPVLIFSIFASNGEAARGMAIPMATDIAFVLAVLTVLRNHVPASLRVFMTTLAVADDIGGIIVIAVFYSTGIDFMMLGIGLAVVLLLAILGARGVRSLGVYLIGLLVVWYFLLQSGVHTTIAGVLVALTVPATPLVSTYTLRRLAEKTMPQLSNEEVLKMPKAVVLSHAELESVNSLAHAASVAVSPVQKLEHKLSDWVNYLVLPIFAFVNAGIDLSTIELSQMSTVPFAIGLGLLLGKSIGIFLFSYIFIRLTGNKWPKGVYPSLLFAVSILGGIGFTVSLFIASLSYPVSTHLSYLNEAKVGILLGSLLSGVLGYLAVLWASNRRSKAIDRSM